MNCKTSCRVLAVVTLIASASVVVITPGILWAEPQQNGEQPRTDDEQKQLAAAKKLDESVDALFEKEEYEAAIEPAQRVLAIREKLLGPEHPETAESINTLAVLYDSLENYDAAEPLYKRGLAIREKILGPEHADTVVSIGNLASVSDSLGNHAAAEQLYKRAITTNEKVYGAEALETASSLTNLAICYENQERYEAAEPHYQRALTIYEKASGAGDPDTATALSSLARCYENQEKYAVAEPLFKRALAIRESTLGSDHLETASSVNNLAVVFHNQQNYADAEPLYQRALQIYAKVADADHADAIACRENFDELIATTRMSKTPVPDGPQPLTDVEKEQLAETKALNNAMFAFYNAGKAAEAVAPARKVVEIRERVLGPDHPDSYHELGDLNAAEPLYRRALKIRIDQLGMDHPYTGSNLVSIASLQARKEKFTEAGDLMDQARRVIRRHVTRVLPSLAETEQAMFLSANYESDLQGALSLGFTKSDDGNLVNLSAGWLLNGKAVAQEALAQRNLLSRDVTDPKLAPVVEQLQQVRGQLAALAMSVSGPGGALDRQPLITKFTAEEQRLTKQLAANGAEVNPINQDWIARDDVQKVMPANSVFIDIARFDVFDFARKVPGQYWQSAHYAAWITSGSPEQDSELVDLGDAAEIDTLVQIARTTLQLALKTVKADGEEKATATVNADLRALARKIWQPLESHLEGVDEIILSPDGTLWLTPWSALPVGNDAEKFLLEKYTLRFVVSGRDLVTKPGEYVTQAPVILANPNFDQGTSEKQSSIKAIFNELQPSDDATTRSFSAKSLVGKVGSLPNTGIEAIAIQPSLEKYTEQKSTLYKERYALERVAKALRRPIVATFATHGFFLPTQEANTSEFNRLESNDTRSVPIDVGGKPIENPLLRCGLLLSGCNNRDSVVGDDDGILTGLEIVGIDFRGTELVVLSACETGIGEVKNGEGVAGLRQAFQLAGAQSVVASLWQVPDGDSAIIMSDFFVNLADGQSRAEALRNAQIKRIEYRRNRFGAAHPIYWAAWTLTGR